MSQESTEPNILSMTELAETTAGRYVQRKYVLKCSIRNATSLFVIFLLHLGAMGYYMQLYYFQYYSVLEETRQIWLYTFIGAGALAAIFLVLWLCSRVIPFYPALIGLGVVLVTYLFNLIVNPMGMKDLYFVPIFYQIFIVVFLCKSLYDGWEYRELSKLLRQERVGVE